MELCASEQARTTVRTFISPCSFSTLPPKSPVSRGNKSWKLRGSSAHLNSAKDNTVQTSRFGGGRVGHFLSLKLHLHTSLSSSKMKLRGKFGRCQASEGPWAIIYKLALAPKLPPQGLPWGTPGLSLELIVRAAKETFPQFANMLSTQQRPGSTRAPNGNERDLGFSRTLLLQSLALILERLVLLNKCLY